MSYSLTPWRHCLGVALLLICACSSSSSANKALEKENKQNASKACPESPLFEKDIPGQDPEFRSPEFWLKGYETPKNNEPLLIASEIEALNQKIAAHAEGSFSIFSKHEDVGLKEKSDERMGWLAEQVRSEKYIEGQSGAFSKAQKVVAGSQSVDEVRMVVKETAVFCAPMDSGLFREPADPAFDRNRCSSLHPGELIQLWRQDEQSSWQLVQSRYTWGWIKAAQLTPPLSDKELKSLERAPFYVVQSESKSPTPEKKLRWGTKLYVAGKNHFFSPTQAGLKESPLPSAEQATQVLPFTREALFQFAFAALDEPYGWGGTQGHRDCSRYLMDLFSLFGIELPRHSSVQAQFGQVVELSKLSEEEKRKEIRKRAKQGAVLLYMPGHIMLYLGEHQEKDYAISAISEYLTPCKNGADTVHRVDRVAVTSLEVGRGTNRRAFIERISSIAVFGP